MTTIKQHYYSFCCDFLLDCRNGRNCQRSTTPEPFANLALARREARDAGWTFVGGQGSRLHTRSYCPSHPRGLFA
jgi:hypothetical protein